MNKEELSFILKEGEGYKVEFKEGFDTKSIAKEITAFANSSGGRIFIGVCDKGEIKGFNVTNKVKSQIQDIARNCDPPIKINISLFDNILIVEIPRGENKPYSCSSGFYIREGPNSQKLSRNEILQFVAGTGKIRFDEQINQNFKFPEDFDENKFNDFLKKSNISSINSVSEVLINLSLAIKSGNKELLNNAGVLLFGKNIERFIKQNFVYCTLFKGKDRVNIIDRKEFKEDLLTNYYEALNFLKKHLKLAYIIEGGGPRKEVLELPEEALKEALINAIIHRDYFETGFGVNVEIFDDRVEITNWGKLLFDEKELGKISISRNPILFDLFYRLDMIEKAGSGIGRIKKLVEERKLVVRFEVGNFFRVIFNRLLIKEGEGGQIGGQKTREKTREKIIGLIKENPKITQEELAEKTKISIKGIEWNLTQLKQKGHIRRVGPDKGGHWEVLDER